MHRFFIAAFLIASLGFAASAREASVFRAGQFEGAKETQDDPRKTVETLREKYQDVVNDLGKKSTGPATIAKQQDIIDLLDKLLDPEDDPPPSSNPPPSTPPPADGSNAPQPKPSASNPPPVDGSNAPQSKPMNPSPKDAPTPNANPAPKQAAGQESKSTKAKGNQSDSAKPPTTLEEAMRKDGRWPIQVRRGSANIDVYGQDRLMPRYEELLREYYRSLAESSRGKSED